MRNACLAAIAAIFAFASLAIAADDKTADALNAARETFTKQLEESQKKLLAFIDSEIERAAKSGSLDAVKALQKEKAAIEADFSYDSKAIRLRTAIIKYRSEAKAARDKLRIALTGARAAYTKELKITEAEAVDAEIKSLDETGKPATATKPKDPPPEVKSVKAADLKAGLGLLLFDRLESQQGENGFVEPSKLGKAASELAVIESLDGWQYDEGKNAVAFGYLRIEAAGEYEFRTYSFYDRNAFFVAGKNVCPYRGSVAGGSEPAGKERISLRSGYVSIASVGYVDAKGSVAVTWKPPGQKDFTPIPVGLLFHDPRDAGKIGGP